MRKVKVAIIGGGTVGGGVWQALQKNGALIAARCGYEIEVNHVVVRDPAKKRPVRIPKRVLSTDWRAAVMDPQTDIVVELVGGLETAEEIVSTSLKQRKPVISANKALLSARGAALWKLARKHGTHLYFEASVAGGIPIIKVLRESLVANRITDIYAIANGTCNYILTKMAREGRAFDDILKEAQELGYAEAEPSLDVDGLDAMHKTGIMGSILSGFWVPEKSIFVKGIRDISPMDLQFADWLGYTIKLIGSIRCMHSEKDQKDGWKRPVLELSVEPTLVPKSHVLASVDGVFNAVFVKGDVVGESLYYGRGAGQDATASSVISDIVDAACDLHQEYEYTLAPFEAFAESGVVRSHADCVANYFIRLEATNRPGTMAQVTAILAEHQIGISSCIQPENHVGETVPLMLMVDQAPFSVFSRALTQLGRLKVVRSRPVYFRVGSFE
jgi:homoserine dehydrogenase